MNSYDHWSGNNERKVRSTINVFFKYASFLVNILIFVECEIFHSEISFINIVTLLSHANPTGLFDVF